jgi:hypothetical protein
LSADKSCQVPLLDLLPELAAVIQSDGKLIVAKIVPVLVAAQFAGGVPVRISNEQLFPLVDSIVSRRAFLVAALN